MVIMEFDTPLTGTHDYYASEHIRLGPGFHYVANGSNLFHGWIDNSGNNTPINYSSTPLFDQNTFDSRPLNLNLSVGKTPGFGLVAEGAANYYIPISLPKGIAQIEPNLLIAYNSQSGDGLLGWGWSLQGLSTISRMPNSIHHDGAFSPVNFDINDKFSLDGSRLISVSGVYGQTGTVYHTELETFSKITQYGDGPEYFKILTKDGKTLEYGLSLDSKILCGPISNPVFWRLNKVTDIHGNFMEFRYINKNRESLIKEIVYTGNGYTNPFNSVQFFYSERNDKNSVYLGSGIQLKTTHLLTKIIVYSEGVKFREYKLNYGFNCHSFLTELKEIGLGAHQFNSTIFKYGEIEPNINCEPNVSELSLGSLFSDYVSLDFNSDGLTDLVELRYIVSGPNKIWQHWNLYKNNGNYEFVISGQTNFPGGSFSGIPSGLFPYRRGRSSETNSISSDINNDGRDDFIVISKSNVAGGYNIIINKYISTGSNLINDGAPWTHFYPTNGPEEFDFRFLEINGDQKIDVLMAGKEQISGIDYSKITIGTQGDLNFSNGNIQDFSFKSSFPIDINGDGINEIAGVKSGNQNVIIKFPENFSSSPLGIIPMPMDYNNYGDAFESETILTGDFNGDGKSDLV